ncbi:hypothetical protein [Maricaulis sp.]|uniref:hypothetical protein n=1 Tax=Maricaulis sp. TaxID=1486257 RepID=UPI003A94B540
MNLENVNVINDLISKISAFALQAKYGRIRGGAKLATNSRRVMIYSSHLGGHRHLYAARFADALHKLGFEVDVVYCGEQDSTSLQWLLHDATQATWKDFTSPSMKGIKDLDGVRVVSLRKSMPSAASELEAIVEYQKAENIAVTFFMDGDAMLKTFLAQGQTGKPRFIGNTYAVCIRYDYLYRRTLPARRLKHLDERRHWLRGVIYEHLLVQPGYLDGILASDDVYAQRHTEAGRVHLIEEVGHYEPEEVLTDEETTLYKRLAGRYQQWKGRHKGKKIVLLFGDLEVRKGFDFLLRLAADRPDLILVRLGRIKPGYQVLNWREVRAREKLIEDDRLLEFSTYCGSQKFIDRLFRDAHYIPLAYRNHARTSGVWRQVMSFGKPVIFPSYGVCGFRTEANRVGLTYEPNNYDSFIAAFDELDSNYDEYAERAQEYFDRRLSDKAFVATLEHCLTESGLMPKASPVKAIENEAVAPATPVAATAPRPRAPARTTA